MEKQWVIDASMGVRDGMFCFCPVEGDVEGEFSVVIGLTLISDTLPDGGRLAAIWHPDGQAAVEQFCTEYDSALAELEARLGAPR